MNPYLLNLRSVSLVPFVHLVRLNPLVPLVRLSPLVHLVRPFFAAAVILVCHTAWAEQADRDKPVNIEADRVTLNEADKVQVFEGNVTLTQGTLVLRGDKIVVTQGLDGFQHGTVTGNLARFRVKREGKDEYVEGEAERIEHDPKTEMSKFFQRAHIKNGQDDVRGQYLEYDGRADNYVVTNGPSNTVLPGKDGRVRVVIQPKTKGTPPPAGEPVRLKKAPKIVNPSQE